MKFVLILSLFILNNVYSKDLLPLNPKFVAAIAQIESKNNDLAVGDNGKALGKFQIWRVCYQDAAEYDKSINFSYESLTNSSNSEKVLKAYLNRYGYNLIKNNDFESLARLWNSGPNWKNKLEKTNKYVEKFNRALNSLTK